MSDRRPGGAGEAAGDPPIPGNELVRRRHEKLRALRAAGVDPFGTSFPVAHWAGPLHARWDNTPEEEIRAAGAVQVAGRVMSVRHHGKSCFANLLDHTGTVQLYARADVLGEAYAGFTDLDVADFVGVTGDLMRTRTGSSPFRSRRGRSSRSPSGRCRRSGTGSRTSRPGTASGTWISSSIPGCATCSGSGRV